MRLRNLAALVAVTLLAALPVVAQEQVGSIEGVIKDAQGGAVVGATVVAKSAKGASAESVTDATGTYRFNALAPGRYELTANLSGFAPAKVQNVDLRLGQQLSINMTLSPSGVTETIQVVGESPLIAITQSARATSIRDEEITKMPKGRDFTSLVAQAAGANPENKLGGLSVDGSSGGENRFIIDGAEATNIQSGAGRNAAGTAGDGATSAGPGGTGAGMRMVTDFVEEVQIKSSGYAAEFGGSTGAVVSVLTKSGSNQFRGDVGVYYSGDALDANPRPTLRLKPTDSRQAEYVTFAEDPYDRWEPGFTLGGPISKDKAWFFVGYNPSFRPYDRTAKFNDGSVGTKTQKLTDQYLVANITAQFGPKLRSRFAYNNSKRKQEGRLQTQSAAADATGSSNPAANYDINDILPVWSTSATFDYTPSNKVFMSLRGSYFKSDLYNEGVFDGTRYLFITSNVGQAGVPAQYQQLTNYSNTPTNTSSTQDVQSRMNAQFDTTFFFQGGGQHQMKVGIQYDRIGNTVLSGETGNLIRLYWDRSFGGQRGPYGYYRVRSNGALPDQGFITQGDIHENNFGLFLQDSWTVGSRLTLNLGLRTESEKIPAYSSGADILEHPIEFTFGDKIAPRAGFAWDATGDGKTKIYGSWGIFYDIIKLEMPRGSWGGDKWLEYWYTLDTPAWDQLDTAGCPTSCPGTLLSGPVDFRHPSAFNGEGGTDPGLKPMKLQEMVFGAEREIAPTLSVSARYVHKQLDRAIEDVGVLDSAGNEIYTIANPGFGLRASFIPDGGTTPITYPKAKRDYDAVEFALNKRLSNRWSGRVSYTWSQLEGNYSGLSQSDENGRTSPNVGRAFDYPLMAFDEAGKPVYGPLGTDRTHQLKAFGTYDFSFGTTLTLAWYGLSGIPMTREAAWNPSSGYPIQYLGRGSDGNMPFINNLDLYAQQEIKLGSKNRLVLSVNVLNVLDADTATNYFATQLESGATVDVAETTILYQGANFQQLIAQQGIRNDPRFLQATAFQAPRSIRLGARFSF
jgi:outer membrane receptor protein involved in Fe transport